MIELIDVGKYYPTEFGKHWVFRNVSLSFGPDKSVAIIGPNGAGKSTFMRLLGGADIPSEGRIIRRGNVSPPMGLTPTLQLNLSGIENTRFAGRIYGLNRDEISDMIDYVRETADIGKFFDMPVATYSAGMRQRVAFSINMSLNFDFYLFDEISAGGDREFKKFSKAKVKERLETSKFIIATHRYDDFLDICDAAIVIQNGELQYFDDMSEALSVYDVESEDDEDDPRARKKEKRRARAEKLATKEEAEESGEDGAAGSERAQKQRDPAKVALRERRLAKVRAALEGDNETSDPAAANDTAEAEPAAEPQSGSAESTATASAPAAASPEAETTTPERASKRREKRLAKIAAAAAEGDGDDASPQPQDNTVTPAETSADVEPASATPPADSTPVEAMDAAEAGRQAKREQKRLTAARRREKRLAKTEAAADPQLETTNLDSQEEADASDAVEAMAAEELTTSDVEAVPGEAAETEATDRKTARRKKRKKAEGRRAKRHAKSESAAAAPEADASVPPSVPAITDQVQPATPTDSDPAEDGNGIAADDAQKDEAGAGDSKRQARRSRRAKRPRHLAAAEEPGEESVSDDPPPVEEHPAPDTSQPVAEAAPSAPARDAATPVQALRALPPATNGLGSLARREALLRQDRSQAKSARAMRLLLQLLETQTSDISTSLPAGRTMLIAAAQESAATEAAAARSWFEEQRPAGALPWAPRTPPSDAQLRHARPHSKTS